MTDLTIIFLTVNKVPKQWAEFQKKTLLEAIGDSSIITISREPLNWGDNLIQTEEPSVNNIYRQVLRGAKKAKTEYIAIAEDDTLYHKSHFEYRPANDTFGYDGHRWGMLTWEEPFYYYKDRISNAAMIASRKLVIKSLEDRFEKYPDTNVGELGKEKGMDLNRYKSEIFWPEIGMVFFSHIDGLDGTEQRQTKKPGVVQAYDIPFWGKAEELRKEWR